MAEITVASIMTSLASIVSGIVEMIVSCAGTLLADPYFFWKALFGVCLLLVGFAFAKFNAN